MRGLTPDQAEKFEALHSPWPQEKPKPPEQMPGDRLEALGDMSLKSRNFGNSLLNYLQILQEHPERYDLHYKVGVIYLLSGKLEAAQKELALVLVHQPEMLQAHEAMGLVHLQNKNYPSGDQRIPATFGPRPPSRPKPTTFWDSPSLSPAGPTGPSWH